MNHSTFHELPPVDAYEDLSEGFSSHIDPPRDEGKPGADKPSFATSTSPFWRINASSDWDEAQLPQREWIVPQYVMRRKVTGLIGAPEAGKSGLALKWAISLALDLPFGDFRPIPLPGEKRRPRRVVILNAEDDEDEQRRRISSLMRGTGRSVADLADNLIRVGPDSGTAKLFEGDGSGEVYPTAAFEELKTFIEKNKVDVLILDPLVELLGGQDENSNGVMGGVFALLRRLAEDCKIAVIVIHHTKKGANIAGNLEAARGGSALGGSIRIGLTLTVMSEAEADELGVPKETRKHYVRLDNAKQSYGPPSDAALWFHRFSVELDNGDSSPALEPWSPPKVREMSLDELAPIIADIQAGCLSGAPFSPKLSNDERSVRHVLEKHGVKGAAQSKTLDRLKDHHGLQAAHFTLRNGTRNYGMKMGLRIGDLPAAEWANG